MYGSESWGKYPKVKQSVRSFSSRRAELESSGRPLLPFGQGRSYGDVCLNDGGEVVTTRLLNNIILFDRKKGILRVEAGISLGEILDVIVPAGWFIPVSPGTQFVSLGGAIANDIHGKNHHVAGTFGRHVRSFLLKRTDGEALVCSCSDNADYYAATIGGLGLTGLVVWAEIQLIPIYNRGIVNENIAFNSLDEFFDISEKSEEGFDYTVAWLDCVSGGSNFGRGIFMRGNHAPEGTHEPKSGNVPVQPVVPMNLPGFCLNTYSVKAFNSLYFALQKRKVGEQLSDYEPFFYPLDSVLHWNRIYGAGGFVQFQCVVPKEGGKDSLGEILKQTVSSGEASFLAVLKEFGDLQSPGMLSFPRPGYTLCLDFAFKGRRTRELMYRLENLVVEAGGALYPAKDALMSPVSFRTCYPELEAFLEWKDPGMSSTFWRRVMEEQ